MKVIGLAQFNVDFDSEYLPYSVSMLQAYAEKFPEIRDNFRFLLPVYKRKEEIGPIVEYLAQADIVAFSIYVWNTHYSLEVAKQIKVRNPKTKIIFGGPNVSDNSEKFLRSNPQVDFTIHAEGEGAFTDFLRASLVGDFSQASSLRWIDAGTGEFHSNKKASRILDLADIPSPYLTGIFDNLMRAHPHQTWNVLWETNRGCPFSCTYCDWGSATQAKVNKFPMERLLEELEWMAKNRISYLMCADANFGIFERDLEIAQKMSDLKRDYGFPQVFAATYTKNATDRSYKIAQILMKAELIRGYTVSTQSVDPTTLKNIRRDNISQKSFTALQAKFNQDKLPTYTDLIIGLPGETFESFKVGVSSVLERGQYNKCYFLILAILPNAQMADPEYRAKHGFETVWGPQKNLHETVREDEKDIVEYQELVVGTSTMPKDDWRKTVSFGYVTSLVYFNKLLHIPITILLRSTQISFEKFISPFHFAKDDPEFPLFSKLNKFFREHTESIQNGGYEYVKTKDWLNVWWQPDKYAFMEVCKDLDSFYAEARKLLSRVLEENHAESLQKYLDEALKLNQALVRSPFQARPTQMSLRSNIYDYYRSIIDQQEIQLVEGTFNYKIENHDESWADRDDWCKKVVWYGNKTSAYLSQCVPVETFAHDPNPEFRPELLKPYLYA